MPRPKNANFLPYFVTVRPPASKGDRWTAEWSGREYRQLHSAPIPLARAPRVDVLKACNLQFSDGRYQFKIGDDGSMTVWIMNGYGDVNHMRGMGEWPDYGERLGKLLKHLRPSPVRHGDSTQPVAR